MEVKFEDLEDPITYEIPRLLPDHKIQAIKDRLAHNRTNKRTEARDYLLDGFIRCYHWKKSLSGQSQVKNGKTYQYYVHPVNKT